MHSMVDWIAFAQWTNGKLLRSLSLSANSGILEDIGKRLAFEQPFWSGEHPAVDEYEEEEDEAYPFPFHPLELGEAALEDLFGYLKPELVHLVRYKRSLENVSIGCASDIPIMILLYSRSVTPGLWFRPEPHVSLWHTAAIEP